MPGLTGDVLLKEAEGLGMPIMWQMTNFTKSQWESLKQACVKALKLPENWEKEGLAHTTEAMRDLGWGTIYGPTGFTTYKKKSLGKARIPEIQGELFETI